MELTLLVKSLDGKTFTITIDPNLSIEQLKTVLRSYEGLEEEQQTIIYAGKVLKDYLTVSDYNLQSLSMIHVFGKLKGS
jgi:hypothetical protein